MLIAQLSNFSSVKVIGGRRRFFVMRFGSGVAVVLGVLLFLYAILAPRGEIIADGPSRQPAE